MRRRGAPVIVGVLDQNVADRFRVAEDDLLAAGEAARDRQLLEGVRRKPGERVVAQARADIAPRLAGGAANGTGKARAVSVAGMSNGILLNSQ